MVDPDAADARGLAARRRSAFPLTYDHGYWGAVFPLGMYTVCTLRLAREFGLPFLAPLGEVFAWVSLAAWAATAVGLARRLTRPPG